MNKTALFYSPEGGNVNRVTIKLGELIGHGLYIYVTDWKWAAGDVLAVEMGY